MAFAAAMLVVALAIIYRGNFNEEGNVYLAFLNEAKNQAHDAAFLSTPSTCQGATKENVPTASSDLFSDFYSANGNGAAPINLRALEGLFNVVSFEEAKQLHENQYLPLFRTSSKILVKLSRVGFDKSKTHALFCIEYPTAGDLVLLVKENGSWKVEATSNVWRS